MGFINLKRIIHAVLVWLLAILSAICLGFMQGE